MFGDIGLQVGMMNPIHATCPHPNLRTTNIIVQNVTKGIEAIGDVVIQDAEPCAIKQVSDKPVKEKEDEEFVAMTDYSVKATDSIQQGARTLAY